MNPGGTIKGAFARFLCLMTIMLPAALPLHRSRVQAPAPAQGSAKAMEPSLLTAAADVVVLDQKGRFVEGMAKEQFELLLDGVPQTIISFGSVTAGSPEEEAQWSKARGDPAPSTPQAAGRTILFFVDDLHMSEASIARAREGLAHYVDSALGPDDRVSIVTSSKRIGFLQRWSRDKSEIRGAAALLASAQPTIKDGQTPPMSEAQALAIENNDPEVLASFVKAAHDSGAQRAGNWRIVAERMVRRRASAIAAASGNVSEAMLSFLVFSLHSYATEPGRKIAFFLSDGFYLRERQSEGVNMLIHATDVASRARIAIYTVNARNLRGEDSKPSGRPDQPAKPAAGDDAQAPQEGLGMLAIGTGGRFLRNAGELATAVTRALAETSRYYLVGWRFAPSITGAGSSKGLKVIARGRPDLTVFQRQSSVDLAGYLPNVYRSDRDRSNEALLGALRSPRPLSALPTYVYCGHAETAERKPNLTITLQVTSELADTSSAQSEPDPAIDMAGVTLTENGLTADAFVGSFPAVDRRKKPPDDKHVELTFTRSIAIPPGSYEVHVAAQDPRSGRTGNAAEPCEAPRYPTDRLFLSSIYFVLRQTGELPPGEPAPGFVSNSRIDAKRKFKPDSRPTYIFDIYNYQRNSGVWGKISVQSKIYRGETVVARDTPRPSPATSDVNATSVRYSGQLSLDGLAAGAYSLEVTATDGSGNQTAKQSVAFSIQ